MRLNETGKFVIRRAVRGLDNGQERAMILGNGEWIAVEDLPGPGRFDGEPCGQAHELRGALQAYETIHIENVFKTHGNREDAAGLSDRSRWSPG